MTIMASHYHGFIYTTIFSNSRTKSMTTQPRYDALAALIATREWWFGASEVQGILSALVACNQGGRWAEILFAQGEIDSIAHEAFDRLSLQIEETLAADALSYQLLLPEDGTLAARAEALAAWAQGFAVAIHWLQPKTTPAPSSPTSKKSANLTATLTTAKKTAASSPASKNTAAWARCSSTPKTTNHRRNPHELDPRSALHRAQCRHPPAF